MLRIIRAEKWHVLRFEETKRGGERLMEWLAQSVLHRVRIDADLLISWEEIVFLHQGPVALGETTR
jgi:hypothetical protein